MARTLLNYGESGTYKSTMVGEFADYQVERMNKVLGRDDTYVRAITDDSGVSPYHSQISRGVVEYWLIGACSKPMTAFKLAGEGLWPVKLVNGVMDESAGMYLTEDWGEVAGYAVEGLKALSEMVSEYLVGAKRSTGEPLVAQFTETMEGAGSVEYAHSSRGTYGFTQARMFEIIKAFKNLPCDRVMWTGHEGKGEDDRKNLIFGPKMVGKAANNQTSEKFEMTLHHQSVLIGNVSQVVMYYERHPDPVMPQIFWPAKLACEPRIKAKILKRWPGRFVPLVMDETGAYVEGLRDLLQLIDDEEAKGIQSDAPSPIVSSSVITPDATKKGKSKK